MKILTGPHAGQSLAIPPGWLKQGEQIGIETSGQLREKRSWHGSENYIVVAAGLMHAPIPERPKRRGRVSA